MALDLGTLRATIEIATDNAISSINNFQNDYNRALQNIQNSSPNLTKLADTFKNVGASLTNSITKPLINLAKECVSLASDMEETQTKSDQIFGNMADTVNKWASSSINSMGMAKQTALDMAASFGDMSVSMGLSTEASAEMSMNLVQLAADLSSFKNISVERAQTALTGIYTGEGEALKSLGIVMNEATLSQFAMASGCSKTYSEMTQAEKVQLRYNYVMNQTTNAQGDFAKTGDGVANSTRKLKEQLKQLGTQFGSVLYPVVQKVLTVLNNFMNVLVNMDSGVLTTITIIGAVVAAVGPLLTAIGSTITAINTIKAALVALQLSTGAIIGIIGAIVAVVGLAAGAFISASNNANEAAAGMDSLAESADSAASSIDGTTGSLDELTSVDAEVEVTATTDSAKTVLNAFLDDVTAATNETYGIKISVNEEAVEIITSFAGVLSSVGKNGHYSSSSLKELQQSIKDTGQAFKDTAAEMVAAQILYVAALVNSGQITEEEGTTRVHNLREAQAQYNAEVDASTQEMVTLSKTMQGNATDSEVLRAAMGVTSNEIYDVGVEAEGTANKLVNFNDIVKQFGVDSETASDYAKDLENSVNDDVQTDIQDTSDIISNYTASVDSVNASEATQVQTALDVAQATKDKAAAFDDYFAKRQQGMSDEEAWAEVEKSYSSEIVTALKADLDQRYSDWQNNAKTREDAQAAFWLKSQNADLTAQNEITAIQASADVNRQNLADECYEALLNSGENYNAEAYDTLISYYEQTGQVDKANQTRQQKELHSHFGEMAATSFTDMNEVATSSVDGWIEGWEQNKSRVLSVATSLASQIKQIFKSGFDIHSPSKWFKDVIGKNIMLGWREGLLGEESNLLNTVKNIGSNFKVGSATALSAATNATYNSKERIGLGSTTANTITQNNTFMSKELTPYEQRMELRKLDKDLAGVFA